MKAILTTVAVLAILTAPVGAAVLWDQSSVDEFGAGFFNSVSGAPPFGVTMYAVSDVTVSGQSWNIDSITTWYSFLDPSWGTAITQGHLHVFPKGGSLPIDGVDDPTVSMLVPMTGVMDGATWRVSATGLNLNLLPGSYWIGMTPIAPSGPFGPEIHLSCTNPIGDPTPSYDPSGFYGPPATWFVSNPGVDASILIEGNQPTAVESTTWSQVKNLYR